MAKWQFRSKTVGDVTKDVPIDDFFTKSSETSSFIRESIQNSLDGRVNQESPVTVKMSIHTNKSKLASKKALEWFAPEGIDHFKSSGSDLINLPKFEEDCPYLVYEDFNTSGLNGDIWQDSSIEGKPNHFYGFYRQEGKTEKATGNGSNGVGKIVFPMASRVRTIFGFTTRSDDKKTYLMGRSSLSYHKVNNQIFTGDGYFANSIQHNTTIAKIPDHIDSKEFTNFPLPIDETEILEKFRQDFNLKRAGENGLSIIIPWLDESINYDELLKCAIEEYYPAVMSGALVIEIFKDDEEKGLKIDVESISELAKAIKTIHDDLLSKILLAEEFYSAPGINNNPGKDNSIELPKINKVTHRWTDKETSDSLLSEEIISNIKENLESKADVAMIKVPVTIYKENLEQASFFTLLIRKINRQIRPTFVRDQLIIPEASRTTLSGYLVMAFLQDKPIDNFARSAENPSHRSWSRQTKQFKKGEYRSGESLLTFIKTAPQQIIQKLVSEDEKPDTTLLSDIFNIETEGEDPASRKRRKVTPPHPNPDPVTRKIYYSENQITNGFKVSGGEDLEANRLFKIRAGYRVSGSNKIKWHEEDFKIEDLEIIYENISELHCSGNTISFIANSKSFSIQVSGFDTNRDLIVAPSSHKMENTNA